MPELKINSKQRIFDIPNQFFDRCHCSTLVKNENGDMLVSYFAGEHEGSMDQAIWLSRRINGEWQTPKRIKYLYGYIHWNPLLHYENGVTYLFYKVGMTVAGWYTMVSVSYDFGETWSESKELVDGDHTPRGSSKNKLFVRPDGTWLGPCSIEHGDWDSFIDISRDKGKTWEKHEIGFDHHTIENPEEVPWKAAGNLWLSDSDVIMRWDGIIQPSIWNSEGENYHALLRSTRGCIYRTDSADNGETWCKAYPTELPNNNCGLDLYKTDKNVLVLVYNPISGNWSARTPLSVALSVDNGKTWCSQTDLETADEEFSYPAIIGNGSNVDIIYTHERKCIMHINADIVD